MPEPQGRAVSQLCAPGPGPTTGTGALWFSGPTTPPSSVSSSYPTGVLCPAASALSLSLRLIPFTCSPLSPTITKGLGPPPSWRLQGCQRRLSERQSSDPSAPPLYFQMLFKLPGFKHKVPANVVPTVSTTMSPSPAYLHASSTLQTVFSLLPLHL